MAWVFFVDNMRRDEQISEKQTENKKRNEISKRAFYVDLFLVLCTHGRPAAVPQGGRFPHSFGQPCREVFSKTTLIQKEVLT